MKSKKRTIYLVATVPMGKTLVRRAFDKLISKARIMPPLHRWGWDWLIPWQKPLRSPHHASRAMLHHFKKLGKVRYYGMNEKGCINLKPDDFFVCLPVPGGGFKLNSRPETDERDSITSATLRANKDTNHNKLLIIPFANDAKLISWARDLVQNYADKVILIGATWWAKDWEKTVWGDMDRSKFLPIDNAVDTSEYPTIKKSFNPAGKRRFFYLGHDAWYKNTAELERIAATIPGFEGLHIGQGKVKGWKECGWGGFSAEFLKKLADDYDIFVTVSTADAQATTIMENMCWGFPIACTAETGYVYPSVVRLSTTDTAENIRLLTELQNMDESKLREMASANHRVIQEKHLFGPYMKKISDFIGLRDE